MNRSRKREGKFGGATDPRGGGEPAARGGTRKAGLVESAAGDKRETRTGELWLREDGILQLRIKRGVEIDLDDAEELIDAVSALSRGKLPLLLDYRWSHSLTHEAQVRFFQPRNISALAILAWTRIGRIASDFLLGTVKAPYPAKVFTSEEEAIVWLAQYR